MLHCRFRKRLAHFDLVASLDMGAETLALVGRSGAGKTSMLNVIAGVTRPDDGVVRLGTRTLVDTQERVCLPPERRGIGYQFQHYALFPHLDVAANIGFGLSALARAERDQRVDEALDMLDLRRLTGTRPQSLSGGERQRVALARAIVTKPALLLLDEPLAALDAENRARIRLDLRSLLRRLAIPAIVVSHDFDDARILGDRVAAVNRGAIVQTGSAAELTQHPADAFVAALTGTNLALVDGERGRERDELVAFDPWSATLSASAPDGPFTWRGEIVDIRPLGACARVLLRAGTDIKVDVAAADAVRFNVGDLAYASVPEASVRRVQRSSGDEKRQSDA